jgi:sulfite reductase alpha subunit-like flavoprotein
VQLVQRLHLALPHRQHRQLPQRAAPPGLQPGGATGLGQPAGGVVRSAEWQARTGELATAEQPAPAIAPPASDPTGSAPFQSARYNATLPPWSAAHAYTHLYGPKATEKSITATVVGNVRVTQVGREYDTHHVMLDFGAMPFPVLEGQSIGIIPPGADAEGRPHHARQYSIASPRNGERPGYNNLSLAVKRVLEDHQGKPVRGVASNYLCDLQVGDKVQVIGPFGTSFLMPNHPRSHIVMICTGTGSAPMRAMTEWRRRLRQSGKFEGGKLMLFFGARTQEELPYFGPLQNLPKDFIDVNFAFSRMNRRGAAQALRAGPDARTRGRPGAAAGRPQRLLLRLRPEGDGRRRGAGPARRGATGRPVLGPDRPGTAARRPPAPGDLLKWTRCASAPAAPAWPRSRWPGPPSSMPSTRP